MKKYPEFAGKKISTNEQGFDFFIDADSTEYARKKLGKEYHVLLVGKDGELLERILCKKSLPIFAHTSIENIGVHIDMLYAAKIRD